MGVVRRTQVWFEGNSKDVAATAVFNGPDNMRRGPFDESVCVIGNRSRWRIVHMLEDGIEHRPGVPGQIGHEPIEAAVEVAKK